MPKRFEQYRFLDGQTSLGPKTFNAIFGDIDTRIADLEELKVSWKAAVQDLVSFGLARMDAVLQPLQQAGGAAIQGVKDRAAMAIQDLGLAVGRVSAVEAEAQVALNGTKEAFRAAQAQAGVYALKSDILAMWPAWPADLGSPTSLALDAQGRAKEFSDVLDGRPRKQVYAYNPTTGLLSTTTTTWNGRTRTEAFTWATDGTFQGSNITEA